MKLSERFPRLEQFFGAYFHQDCLDFDGTAEMVLKRYASEASRGVMGRTLEELDQLLSLGLSDAELDRAMYEDLGCYYNPEPDGMSMTEWLQWVRTMLIKYEQLAPKGR